MKMINGQMNRRSGMLLALLMLLTALGGMVPPHPMYQDPPAQLKRTQVERTVPFDLKQMRSIPNNVLVLRVQFSDVRFQSTPVYPDYLPHDHAYFDRWMLHLSDFFYDASQGQYTLNYYLPQTVYTLSRPMGYYGEDTSETIDARVEEMIAELVALADPEINFNLYGGLIVFHAGPGQESDISGIRRGQIWSTFITRKNLQAAFDPDNDDYPGLVTSDGAILKNIVLVPESEYQDYFPPEGAPDASVYLFSIYGVLSHQFGHLIGLPTLFDNVSANGRSQGIGNWGLMGTGVWNANGYVPAQLSAWCRYYLGWEQPQVISYDTTGLVLDHFLDRTPGALRMYKVPISAREYFLVENRQQNPDGSLDPYNNLPSYTFKLLPEGEQDYYEDAPLRPFFNFMNNRYQGCEWDFFLPGLGGPLLPGENHPTDGSGILIWHIDENVIEANFDPDFDKNTANGNAAHKGVDLEEADGIQHLDTAVFDYYKYGGPFDSFRAGNNDYFGNQTHNGLLRLPTAESHYGGIPLEIYDISASGNQMSFSVRFDWKLDTSYTGINPFAGSAVDFTGDSEHEIFYALPDGQIYLWKNDLLMPGYPLELDSMYVHYVWDGRTFYLPLQNQDAIRLYCLRHNHSGYALTLINRVWAAAPMDCGEVLALPLNKTDDWGSEIILMNKQSQTIAERIEMNRRIRSNLVWENGFIYGLLVNPTQNYDLFFYNLQMTIYDDLPLPISADSLIIGIYRAPVTPGGGYSETIIQTPHSIIMLDSQRNHAEGYPVILPFRTTSPLTIADVDRNGTLDLLVACDSTFAVYDYAGKLMSPAGLNIQNSIADGNGGSVMALDLNGDGRIEYIGTFAQNRMLAWNDDFRVRSGFPVSFGERSRTLPFMGKDTDNRIYMYYSSDDGKIYRKYLPDATMNAINGQWFTEFGDLRRTASRGRDDLTNQYASTRIFVPGEVFIFPNPYKSIYPRQMTLQVMTSRDTDILVRIFDISGKLVYTQKGRCQAYLRNRDVIDLPLEKLSSGVYIAVISGSGESVHHKFAIEK